MMNKAKLISQAKPGFTRIDYPQGEEPNLI